MMYMDALEPKIMLLTADAASISEGKINMLGAGWTRVSAGPANFCVVVRLEIPWSMTNVKIPWSLDLIDQDGHQYVPVENSGALHFEGEVEVGRPAGLSEGSSLEAPLLMPFVQLPLRIGKYEWRFQVGQTTAKYAFSVV